MLAILSPRDQADPDAEQVVWQFHHESAAWSAVGVYLYRDVARLKAIRISPPEYQKWADGGIGRSVDIEAWVLAKFTPSDAAEWVRHGFTGPQDAILWKRFRPATAAQWRKAFDLADAVAWTEALGPLGGPSVAKEWSAYGFAADETAGWRGHGFQPWDAKAWAAMDCTPAQARDLTQRGILPN